MSQVSAGMHDATRSRTPPHPVDNTDWLKTVAIICVSAGHIGFFFIERRVVVECFWTLCSSAVLLPCGLRADPYCPASLDMDRRHSDLCSKAGTPTGPG